MSARVNAFSFNVAGEILRQRNCASPNAAALLFKDKTITNSEFVAQVLRTAAALKADGVGRADRVGIVLPDTPEFAYLFLASILVGAIPIPLNPGHNPTDLVDMLGHIGARITFTDGTADLRALTAVNVSAWYQRNVDSKASPVFSDSLVESMHPEDPVYLLFSSGTTGRPKAIIRRHRDIAAIADTFGDTVLQLRHTDRVLAVSKLTFGYSLVGNLILALYGGAASILMPQKSTSSVLLDAMRRYRPTIFLAQPRMLNELSSLLKDPELLSSVRLVVSAGDILSDTVRTRWLETTGLEPVDGFGSTEAGHIFLYSVGPQTGGLVPLQGYEIRLVDSQGVDVLEGTPGRLCVQGRSVSSGYWNDPDRSQRSFKDGWFVSDDIFSCSRGSYTYMGRADDMIKTGCGEWVRPHLIEGLLLSDGAVRDCAVVGTHDDSQVVRVKAFVVTALPAASGGALTQRLKELPVREWPGLEHMRIHAVEYVNTIPRSANGKIQRHLLKPASLTDFAYEC